MSDSPTIKRTVCLSFIVLLNFITSVLSQCSGSLTLTATDEFSTFTSPGYSSGSYDNDLSCSWIIDSGSASETVAIFITNYALTSPDKIDIYNGFSTSNSSLVTGLTGSGSNKDYKTTGQYALVVLTTDSSGQAQGFTALYLKAKDLSGTGCSSEQTIVATSTPQYLTSPNFPNEYTGNSNCRWVITSTGGTVEFDVILTDIESSPNCGFDYLKIYDSSYLCEHTMTVNVCSRYSWTTFSYKSNGSILVLFVSDATVGYTGFKLKFSGTEETTTLASVASDAEASGGFGLGIGVGFAGGFISALMTVGLILVIKSRVQASQLGSPRVRNVLPLQTPTSINGHVPNGDISANRKFSNSSSSGNSSRRTNSTRHNSPDYSDSSNGVVNVKTDNNHKRNGVLPTRISLPR